MALDPHYFSLKTGLHSVWNGSEHFAYEHKLLVTSAIAGLSPDAFPESEEQLDQLQVAIVASEYLSGFESESVQWLSDSSRELPNAFRRFVHEVASYFHKSEQCLPDCFVGPLSKFISETKSHVAVLNYDNLLYDAFNTYRILSGYSGTLIDGFLKLGFAKENLDRYYESRLGWYLHLHGSPLYVDNQKLMGGDRVFVMPDERCHVVLTHVEHKPLVIASSPILSEYWSRLPKSIKEAEKIVLFGYSGCDTHLNEILTSYCGSKEIHILEWNGAGNLDYRLTYWRRELQDMEIILHQFENLLDFQDWYAL